MIRKTFSLAISFGISPIAAWNLIFIPSKVELNSVNHRYPESFMRSLFSSIPKRDYSIDDLSIKFQGEFSLLVGRSASGKSTVLNLIAGTIPPLEGSVKNTSKQPILLDAKPDCYDERNTVMGRIKNSNKSEIDGSLMDEIATTYAAFLTLSKEQLFGLPSQLSPSGQYLFGIACACMESCDICIKENSDVLISAPILLLDELLDRETSSVASVVGKGLQNLARNGGTVLMATHRPEYVKAHADRVITMSSGRILTVT